MATVHEVRQWLTGFPNQHQVLRNQEGLEVYRDDGTSDKIELIKAPIFDDRGDRVVELPEPLTCKSHDFGPWIVKKNIDRWLQHEDGDRTCSLCGSLHQDDFLAYVAKSLTEDGVGIEIEEEDFNHKIWVRRPSGGIKFCTWHAVKQPTVRQQADFEEAIRRSNRIISQMITPAMVIIRKP